ncbi:MAG TPA: PriCT-2 domain-containing protein [Rhodoferax sp.]
MQAVCLPGSNNYFNSSSVHADADGDLKARKNNVAAFHFVLLDDVGTKVETEKLNEFKASWAIETSPGNYQLGILLATPLANAAEVTALQDAVIAAGLCDPGANGMTRWARLPVGVNGKAKYTSDAGQPFQCRLVRWRPEMRYTVDEIVAGLKLEMAPVKAPVQHVAQDARMAVDVTAAKAIDPADVDKVPLLLAAIDPDCGRTDWIRVLMAVYHTTGGSEAGFALVDAWSSKGKKYPGTKDVEIQWRSFSGNVQRPITIGTLIKMARDGGADVTAITQHSAEAFVPCATEVVPVGVAATKPPADRINPLARFSLLGRTQELEVQMVEQKAIFGNLILQGQTSVIYAPPNTGKTLILMHLIIESIKSGRIDPSKLFYLNMDDNSSGLVGKNKWTDEYGFHMLADGHQGFQVSDFQLAMEEMVASGTAKGVIVILDTLKKFVNPMAKDACRAFTKMARRFSLKGGTFVALSHVNKNRGTDGKLIYSGTSDIVDDFDCVYVLDTVEQDDQSQKLVEFSNRKNRGGGVASSVAYSYSMESGLLYNELLLSVQEVDPAHLLPIKQAAELDSDATVIAAIETSIADGIVTKMKLADAAAKHADVPQRAALKVIEKYTGNDPSIHRWTFVVRARGAKVFELLAPHTAPTLAVLENTAQLPVDLTQEPQNAGLPEPGVATALTVEEQFHMGIVREGMELCGDAGYTEDQTHDEF